MARRRHQAAGHAPAAAATAGTATPSLTVDHFMAGTEKRVVLLVDRLNAHRQWCQAGTVIAPDVDGWPAHRVALHVRHGYAREEG